MENAAVGFTSEVLVSELTRHTGLYSTYYFMTDNVYKHTSLLIVFLFHNTIRVALLLTCICVNEAGTV